MRDPFRNPFPSGDEGRRAIWEMLVERDIAAFLSCDWGMVADDFAVDEFFGIDARRSADPDDWRLAFPTLAAYRDEWLRQAESFAATRYLDEPRAAIFAAAVLEDIAIADGRALVRKKFDGGLRRADGEFERMEWQTLYHCRFREGRWRIVGFTGYLPNPSKAG